MKKIITTVILVLGILVGTVSITVPVSAHAEESVYPEVLSNACLVGDYDDERILYMEAKDEEALLSPASTTKVMTALLVVEAIERGDLALDEIITVGTEIKSIHYSTDSNAGLVVGEELTVNDLLGVMLVQSACEAANVLAIRLAGSEREFVHLMNTRANELHMESTVYRNAHGLYDAEHVTTVLDMYRLMREAASHDLLMSYLTAARWDVAQTNKSKSRSYINHARLLDQSNVNYCSYAIGGKSGYLDGYASALILLGEIPDELGEGGVHRVIVVLHNTDQLSYWQAFTRLYFDTKSLLDWTASHFSTQMLVSSSESLGTIPVQNSLTEELAYYVASDFSYFMPNSYYEDALQKIMMTEPLLDAPVAAGQKVGTYVLKYNDSIIFRSDLVVREGAEQLVPDPLLNMWQGALVALLVVALFGCFVYLVLRKKKK